MPRRTVLFLFLLAIGPAACGGGSHSPSGPTTMPTPPGTSVTLVVFYDENANGVADGTEVVRVPDVEVSIGGRSAKSEKLTGQAVVTGVQNGNYTVAVRNDTLPPFYQPGAPVSLTVPLGQGSLTFVPLLLPIGHNNPNQYLAFGDSITRGDGSDTGGYPPRLQAKLSAHFGYAEVRNRGADATNSYEAVERINNNNNLRNDAYALILYGTNDWNIPECQDAPATCPTIANLRLVLQRVKAAGTLPFIATLIPTNPAVNPERNQWVTTINTAIKALAQEQGAFLVDLYQAFQNQGGDLSRFYSDPVHPNDAGYDVIANGYFEAIAHGKAAP
jgi:lysophospholipase L1-like esterase